MIILYSTGCPKCRILEKKLDEKGIKYSVETDVDEMVRLGFMELPQLKVDDKILNFTEAVSWINNCEGIR